MSFFKNFSDNFNFNKFIVALAGGILMVITTTHKTKHFFYYILVLLAWTLIAYAISLKKNAVNIFDLEPYKFWAVVPSTTSIAISLILLVIYDRHSIYKYYYYVLAIILAVMGKAGIIFVELGLFSWEQFFTILSVIFVIIGSLTDVLNLKEKGMKDLYWFGKFVEIMGWALFIFNISYNPKFKSIMSLMALNNPQPKSQ